MTRQKRLNEWIRLYDEACEVAYSKKERLELMFIQAERMFAKPLKELLEQVDDETITDEIRTQIGTSATYIKALQNARKAIEE